MQVCAIPPAVEPGGAKSCPEPVASAARHPRPDPVMSLPLNVFDVHRSAC